MFLHLLMAEFDALVTDVGAACPRDEQVDLFLRPAAEGAAVRRRRA
jgi:hypothetical protein